MSETTSKNDELYVLTLTREQALVVEQACELMSRLYIGQFNRITELMLDVRDVKDYCRRRDDANDALKLAANLIFGRNLYNQPDTKKGVENLRSWTVYTTLRYTRSWHENPSGGTSVCFHEPMPTCGDPLPKCEIIKKK